MDDDAPPPNYASLVERELRIADNLTHCEKLWAEILSHYGDYARRLRYIHVSRDRRRPRA